MSSPSTTMALNLGSNSDSTEKPFSRATIKTDQAKGSPTVDWSRVSVIFTTSGGNAAQGVFLTLQITNHMAKSPLNGLKLDLKAHGTTALGNVAPGGTLESPQLGPFVLVASDSGQDIKGLLSTDDCNVSIKIRIPATLHVSPMQGLSLDSVAEQLSSREWSSSSAKVPIVTPGMTAEGVQIIVALFLQMAKVEAPNNPPTHATFAGRTASGLEVFALLKVKSDTVKVDLRSTLPEIGKSIASDLKKLVL